MDQADGNVAVGASGAVPAESGGACGLRICVRGIVQGVGFRPAVCRLARDCGLHGEVCNEGAGVLIHAWGDASALARFSERLKQEVPTIARIESIDTEPLPPVKPQGGFRIVASTADKVRAAVACDGATCAACLAEMFDPASRRFHYPFTHCMHCGPRFSIVRAIPYARGNSSMSPFTLCADCRVEYDDADGRRFHAPTVACPACGPQLAITDPFGRELPGDPVQVAASLIAQGAIVAVKAFGGYHLACDAVNHRAVARLRLRKHRDRKPFALMAPSVAAIERYCAVSSTERALLESAAAPIVLLRRRSEALSHAIAPGLNRLGFMLPYTALHHLLLRALDRPLVMTSGNVSDEPQCTDDREARERLGGIADAWLAHDREIVNRIDDSVVQVMDRKAHVLRRARGYAPEPLALPHGFESMPAVIAMGGMSNNTFCLAREGEAILSQHQGDLRHARAYADYRRNIELYCALFEHSPEAVAVDAHRGYLSREFGEEWAARTQRRLAVVQHHHAHIASCLAENQLPWGAPRVLGIALDGLGMGEDGELWGGEFLLADYRQSCRVARLKPVALVGGHRATREPWRNTYAHLAALPEWPELRARYRDLELMRFLENSPRATFDAMGGMDSGAPCASSCGRLFDAVAGALGICRQRASYEGRAAIELEALATRAGGEQVAYPFDVAAGTGLTTLDPAPMWRALLDDVAHDVPPQVISARFHRGLAGALVALAHDIAARFGIAAVALSGGVFQNRVLFEHVASGLRGHGLRVLAHRHVPAGDGGLALGQAVIASARLMECEGQAEA